MLVVALWDKDPTLSSAAQNALEAAFNRGTLAVSAAGFRGVDRCSRQDRGFRDSLSRRDGSCH